LLMLDCEGIEGGLRVPGPITRTLRGRQCRLHRGGVAIAIFALFAASCVAPFSPRFSYAHGTDAKGRPRPQHFLILPCNVTVPAPGILENTTGDVLGALVGFLRDRGDSIELLGLNRAHELWRASVAEVEGSTTLTHDYKTAVQVFVSRVRELASFDVLIVPSLVYPRETEVKAKQRQVKWDGVIRRYRVINYSEEAKKSQLAASISPVVPGVSLHLVLLSPDGTSIFEKYGGIDLIHDVDLKRSEITMTSDLALRERLFGDAEYLREGIAVAFDPYLPR
jgi:hypothetical protein